MFAEGDRLPVKATPCSMIQNHVHYVCLLCPLSTALSLSTPSFPAGVVRLVRTTLAPPLSHFIDPQRCSRLTSTYAEQIRCRSRSRPGRQWAWFRMIRAVKKIEAPSRVVHHQILPYGSPRGVSEEITIHRIRYSDERPWLLPHRGSHFYVGDHAGKCTCTCLT